MHDRACAFLFLFFFSLHTNVKWMAKTQKVFCFKLKMVSCKHPLFCSGSRRMWEICQSCYRLIGNTCLWQRFCNTDITYLTAHFVAVSKWNVQWVALKCVFNTWRWPCFYYVVACIVAIQNSNVRWVKVNALLCWKITLLLHQTQP